MVNKTGFKLMTNCEKCPCLNRDCEDGGSCNLGYHTDLFWTKKNEVIYRSNNCKLEVIRYAKKVFRPLKAQVLGRYAFSKTYLANERFTASSLNSLNDLRSIIELTPAAPPKRG